MDQFSTLGQQCIEDNPDDVLRVREMLAQNLDYNYELEHLTSVLAGLERLSKGDIDLILLDMGLSDLQGNEAIQVLKKQFPALPIVVLTGTDLEKERGIQALKLGIQDYLVKEEINGPVLARAIRNAKEKKVLDQLKESFIGSVSHEMRTPVTVMSLGLQNLQDGILGPLNEKQAQAVETNLRNAKHLAKLIDDLLDLSRLQSGRAKIGTKGVDLGDLIHEVIRNFPMEGREGGLPIQEVVAASLPAASCDPDLISEVLTNLLSNAVRYARTGIVVKAATLDGEAGPPPRFILTSVANDGPGIPRERLGDLFEKFVQWDRDKR